MNYQGSKMYNSVAVKNLSRQKKSDGLNDSINMLLLKFYFVKLLFGII